MSAVTPIILKTKRLILRPWRQEDFAPFAQLNADPKVMEFFPSTLSQEESDRVAKRMSSKIEQQGWGFWAVSVPGLAEFIGFIGICQIPFTAHFTPAVEIGWRLARDYWGQGYAHEGARACLKFGFEQLHLGEIVSFTTPANLRSRRVMEKLGMHRNEDDDFDKPNMTEDHPMRRHVLYRISASEFTD